MRDRLHVFPHGLGDAVMFTAVLRQLAACQPDTANDVAVLKGKHSALAGLARACFVDTEPDGGRYGCVIRHDWPDCREAWPDSPGTKAAKCLRDVFGLAPDWDLLTYSVPVGDAARARADAYVRTLPARPFALLHYQGNTSTERKNLTHQTAREVCDWLRDRGLTPVVLDWDRRSPLPDGETVFNPGVEDPLWLGYGTGDAETIAALTARAALFVGIDSGPCKVAYATTTPTVTAWAGHHPYHYCDRAENTVHVVPHNHADHLHGDRAAALAFFEKRYKYEAYAPGQLAGVIKQQAAKMLGLPYNPMAAPELLTATAFHVDYYEQHKAAGLDYLSHGGWQEGYGKWFAEALSLHGKSVLDVGCACGSVAAGFAKAGALVSGCDVNEHMVRLGRDRWLASQLMVCDATNLHYWKDGTFDFVHSAQVFEHFKPELVPFILKEIKRVLKPGGALFACLDTTEMYARQGRDLATEDATHTCVRPMAWWDELLTAGGWEHAGDQADRLRGHPDNYFKDYDWDWFIVRPKA